MKSPLVQIVVDMVYKGLENFGRYYSEYNGFCVDNEDPEGMARIRIVVPGIIDNPSDEWVYGSNIFSGIDYGCHILPQKGEVITVIFEMGDPSKPRWKHGYFGKGDIPKELRSPNLYWFKTPNGLLVEMDDDKEEVRVTDTHKNTIHLSAKGISIDSPNKIFMGATEKGADSATLGNQTETVLKEHNKGIQDALTGLDDVNGKLQGLMQTMIASGTPASMLIALGLKVPGYIKDLTSTSALTQNTNKSITTLTKDIPKVKSQKIKIHE
jgi:hypothetical protein